MFMRAINRNLKAVSFYVYHLTIYGDEIVRRYGGRNHHVRQRVYPDGAPVGADLLSAADSLRRDWHDDSEDTGAEWLL
jgi:hypothetical protein